LVQVYDTNRFSNVRTNFFDYPVIVEITKSA
jgi:hypothetical protein